MRNLILVILIFSIIIRFKIFKGEEIMHFNSALYDVNGSIDPRARATINLEDGKLDTVVDNTGGVAVDTKLLQVGIGNKNALAAQVEMDLKKLKADVDALAQLDIGGGVSIDNIVDVEGGAGSISDIKANIDIKNLEGSITASKDSGIGGIINGKDTSILGGIGNSVGLDGSIDIKEGLGNLDFRSDTGTDGQIQLPGKLGGLVYHIDDVTEITGRIDFSDLSQRSWQILKETSIAATINLPGDKLEDINIDINPGINIEGPVIDLSKLGNLRLLGFADRFAADILSITEFNMLTESNIMKALSSGLEFAARLDILRVLADQIGQISAMPIVVHTVRSVLADLVSILEALRRVKLLPDNVRSVGNALSQFDLSELKIELSQLEALSIGGEKPGLDGFVSDEKIAEEKAKVDGSINRAGNSLSNFNMGEFLSMVDLGHRISDTTLDAVADLSKPSISNAISAANSAVNIGNISSVIPTVVNSAAAINKISSNGFSGDSVGHITNQILNSTPSDIITGSNYIDNILSSDIGNAVNNALKSTNLDNIVNEANGQSVNNILQNAKATADAAIDGKIKSELINVSGPGVNDVIKAAGSTVSSVVNNNNNNNNNNNHNNNNNSVGNVAGGIVNAVNAATGNGSNNNNNNNNNNNDNIKINTKALQDALKNIQMPNMDIANAAAKQAQNIAKNIPSEVNIDTDNIINKIKDVV